jgi:hypothetical protein
MPKFRVTEQVASVVEVTYDVECADEDEVEEARDDWQEIDRETLRKNIEIISVEVVDEP